MVTPLGMLDIVIAHAAPYEELLAGSQRMSAQGVTFDACDPRSVLRALESKSRSKDRERMAIYAEMRRRFGMAEVTRPA
jgi:hypothetical protein